MKVTHGDNQLKESPTRISLSLKVPVVQRLDNTIHQINHHPVDCMACFVNTYPLDSDYPAFEQLAPKVTRYCTTLTKET